MEVGLPPLLSGKRDGDEAPKTLQPSTEGVEGVGKWVEDGNGDGVSKYCPTQDASGTDWGGDLLPLPW